MLAPMTFPVMVVTPVPIAVTLILPLVPTPMAQTAMLPMVPMTLAGVRNGAVSLGASLRDRATLPSPLRGLG